MNLTDKITVTNEDNMKLMARYPDNYFDLAIIDPPYGIKRFKKAFGSTRFKMDSRTEKNGLQWDEKPDLFFFNELFRVSKNQIIWGANNFNLPTTEYFCIWDKKQTVENFASAEYGWISPEMKKPAKVFRYSIQKHNHVDKIHPTQKPVKLYEWLLDNYAKEGDKILDTHLGSGSIAIACNNRGFELIACELDKEYYNNFIKRFKQETAQIRLF